MIKVTIPALPAAQAALSGYGRQIPFATALAIHRTAHIARRAGVEEMRRQFDRPTPTVLNSLFVRPSRVSKKAIGSGGSVPSSELAVKDLAFGSTIKDYSPSVPEPGSMAEKIGHQFSGGQRVRKGLERGLQRGGYIAADEFLAPGPDVALDQYGNLPRGFVQRVLSALLVQRDPTANATSSRRSRRNAKRAGSMFWSAGSTKKGGLRRGLWARDAAGNPLLLLVVIGTPNYRRRIDLHRIVQDAVNANFSAQFDAALKQAIAGAK